MILAERMTLEDELLQFGQGLPTSMSLCRYFTAEGGLNVLSDAELMVIPPKYLNDPFECAPVIKCTNPEAYTQSKFDEIVTSPAFFEENRHHFPVETFKEFRSAITRQGPALLAKMVMGVSETDRHIQEKAQDIISSKYGVICFAANPLHPTMWAHYADSHHGLVIEFCADSEIFSGGSFLRIEYCDEPFVFDASNPSGSDDVTLFLRRKGTAWSYEEESRLVVDLSLTVEHILREGPRRFIPINPQIIISVTLGLRTTPQVKSRLLELLERPKLRHIRAFAARKNVEKGALERLPL